MFHILIAISFMVIHRVRVVIYDSDESILWFINLQSAFTLSLYFLSIFIIFFLCSSSFKYLFANIDTTPASP